MIRRLLHLVGTMLLGAAVAACGSSLAGVRPLAQDGAAQYRLATGDELRVIVPGLTTGLLPTGTKRLGQVVSRFGEVPRACAR